MYKKLFPHEWEIKEAQNKKEKERIINKINEEK